MNLRGLIQGGVDQAWSLLGTDILETVLVTHYNRGAYNPATGAVSYATAVATVKAARVDATLGLLAAQGGADAGDQLRATRSYLVRVKDLSFTPIVGDTVTGSDGASSITNVANHGGVVWEIGVKV